MKRIILALAFAVIAVCGNSKTASAQEILLEGPLAGAPAVRKLVKYRETRFSVGPQFGYTLLNNYMHNFMLGGKLEFNVLDWLSLGVVGYGVINAPTKLTNHVSESEDFSGQPTVPSESNYPSYTGAENFEEQVARLKGLYVAQIGLIPLRGKLAMFEKLFVAVDGAIFLGGGIVHLEERKPCSGASCGEWTDPSTWEPERETRIAGTFTLGVGFTAYFNNWFGINLEYRIAPFKWNEGGTDEAGRAGTQWVGSDEDCYGDAAVCWAPDANGTGDYPDGKINKEDRTWNANQSIAIGFIFHFPLDPKITN